MLLGVMGPVQDLATEGGKVFAGLYALYAGLVFLVVAALLLTPIFHRLLHRFHWTNLPKMAGHTAQLHSVSHTRTNHALSAGRAERKPDNGCKLPDGARSACSYSLPNCRSYPGVSGRKTYWGSPHPRPPGARSCGPTGFSREHLTRARGSGPNRFGKTEDVLRMASRFAILLGSQRRYKQNALL